MNNRTLSILLVAGALLLPTLALSPAASQSLAPDMSVTSLVVGRLVYPPTRFTFATTVCNLGNDTAPAGAQMIWTAQPLPGPLRLGPGDVRIIGNTPLAQSFAPGDCILMNTFWNSEDEDLFGAQNFGEWEFSARVTVSGDSDPSNDIKVVQTAFPAALYGTDVGGFDPPQI